MSMQITVDPSGMTQAQREIVAGFILAYPTGKSVGTLSVDVTADTSKLHEALKKIQSAPIAPDDVPNAGALSPGEAFTHIDISRTVLPNGNVSTVSVGLPPDVDPSQVFGVPPAPNVPNASAPASAPVAAPLTNLAPPPPPATSSVELDAVGLPWNAKIHAESKAKIADGTWRKKRNLDPVVLATVEAELRQLMSIPAAAPSAPPPPPLAPAAPASIAGAPQAAAFGVGASVGNVMPPTAAITGAPAHVQNQTTAPTGEISADARQKYVSLIGRASAALQAGKVTQLEITQCCTHVGVPALPLLANRLDLVDVVAANIDALIAARQ